MITLSKSGSTVTFTFDENSGYLQNGTIDVPINSLALITDESDMATFRKSASNDIFISARYEEFGMSKAELEAWYKANMVGSTGGGGGVTPEEVQGMIDESISGKADTSAVTESISAATDDMATKTWVGEQGYLTEHQSLSAYSTTEEVNSAITEATSGKVDTSTYNTYTANTSTEIGNKLAVSDFNSYSGAVDTAINSKASESDLSALTDVVSAHTANTDIHVTTAQTAAWNAKSDFSGSYNDLTDKPTIPTVPTSNTAFTNDAGYITEDAISGKADSSAVTEEISAAVSGKVDTSTFETYSGSVETALSGKQDTLSAGTNITISGNVISAEGGGKAIEAGRGIDVASGTSAYTVSFNLPISAGTAANSLKIAGGSVATGQRSIAIGNNSQAKGHGSIAINQSEASGQDSFSQGTSKAMKLMSSAFGQQNYSNNDAELSCGQYNNSVSASTTFGDSGNTLFSVGNGTSNSARHNAFEIRQNGDIYLSLNGQDVKLQDNLGGGTASSAITSGDTNPVQGGVLYNELRIDGKDWLTLEWNNYDGGEATNYPSGESSKIMFEVVASGGTEEDPWVEESNGFSFQDSENNELGLIVINIDDGVVTVDDESSHDVTYSISGNIVTVEYPSIAANVDNIYSLYDSHWVTKAEVDAKVPLINQVSANTATLASLEENVNEIEEVAAAGLNALNDKFDGMKLKKLTQSQYDALAPNYDASTLYVIVN